jgi:hypothetical protein
MPLLPPPDIGSVYVDQKTGAPSKDFYNWIRSIYEFTRAGLATPAVTVAGLPPTPGRAGSRAFVVNATVTTFGSVVVGGGSNYVPVYCDGVNWRIG